MYPDLPLRFIKIHGDILVSYANKEICFISRPGDGLSYVLLLLSVRVESKANAGLERNGKIIVAGVGKQRFDV